MGGKEQGELRLRLSLLNCIVCSLSISLFRDLPGRGSHSLSVHNGRVWGCHKCQTWELLRRSGTFAASLSGNLDMIIFLLFCFRLAQSMVNQAVAAADVPRRKPRQQHI